MSWSVPWQNFHLSVCKTHSAESFVHFHRKSRRIPLQISNFYEQSLLHTFIAAFFLSHVLQWWNIRAQLFHSTINTEIPSCSHPWRLLRHFSLQETFLQIFSCSIDLLRLLNRITYKVSFVELNFKCSRRCATCDSHRHRENFCVWFLVFWLLASTRKIH